jgi:hypothetical protein
MGIAFRKKKAANLNSQFHRSVCIFAPCSVNAVEIVGGPNPGGLIKLK